VRRPIYFFVVFWGARFRGYFANILLRSLLAPNNLPLLAREGGHKLLVCCPAEDWRVLQSLPAFSAAARYVEPVHVPFEPPPPGRAPVDHMSDGQLLAMARCFDGEAYGSLLHPDMLFADGFVACLLRHVATGTEALLVPALRLAEEPLFRHLGLDEGRISGEALIYTSRMVVAALVASLHDEIVECEMGGPRLSILPNCVWWRGPQSGILVHSFSWSPLLIDYAVVPSHVTEGLRGPVADGDYVARNLPFNARIVFASDSDDVAFASWTPSDIGAREHRPSLLQNLPMFGCLLRRAILRRAFLHYARDFYPLGDHVKAKGFLVPIKLHAGELDSRWDALEARAEQEIATAAGDLFDPPTAQPSWHTRFADLLVRMLPAYERGQRLLRALRFIRRRGVAALCGDAEARTWILHRLRARLGLPASAVSRGARPSSRRGS
jgi:hypothetical protein